MPALSETERAVAVDLLDAHAFSVGKDISQYVSETFGDTIFTNEGTKRPQMLHRRKSKRGGTIH